MIKLVRAKGVGKTPLGAFDNALYNCGIHNHNLLYLSSVIPSGQTVEIVDRYEDSKRWGSKLYVVMAHEESDTEAQASIGWLYDQDCGNGLFVEHEGIHSIKDNNDTLDDLAKTRGITHYEKRGYAMHVTREQGEEYVCAMVVAVFEEEDWRTL